MRTLTAATARLSLVVAALMTFVLPAPALHAQPKDRAKITKTAVDRTAYHAGDKGTLAVVLEIPEGFHAQSHTPLEEFLIKFQVKPDKNDAVTFGEIPYPPPVLETYPALGKVSVYTGTVVLLVPFEVKADAAAGDLKLAGSLNYQLCDDQQCYPPEKPKFSVETKVVGKGEETKANETDAGLFKVPDAPAPPAPARGGSSGGGGGGNNTASAAAAPATIFGKTLGKDAYLLAFTGAFLVGVIFNVMPCVLPVVPLKILGFYEVSKHNRAKSIAFGAVFSAGLISSFGVLAVLIVGLKTFDWGELFTKTWFVIPMVIVLTAMAVSMFGVFNVAVPTALYNVTPRHDTYVGNFLFGILTAALSTPCTFGMFVGLLAWALTQPAFIGVSLIMTVGVGMASPYLLLSAMPELARRFPRGGAWGEVVKQFMGFLLLATAAYFASPLLRKVTSQEGVWWGIFACIAGGSLFLLVKGVRVSRSPVGRVGAVVVAVLLLAPSIYAVRILTAKPFQWTPFSQQALADARASGKIVLVEFTATWCGNCHYLEATVLKSAPIVAAVRDHEVVMIKADVTDDDAPGRPLLNQLSPAGAIPLTAVYAPGRDAPIQLTGIYDRADLKRTLEDASKKDVLAATR